MSERAIMSGHCATPSTADPQSSHDRCARWLASGRSARPGQEFRPCPCACHYAHLERLECGCGRVLVETDWENTDPDDVDEDGNLYPVYVHLARDGSLIGQECP